MNTITCARCGQETPFAYRKKFCTACNAKINREQAAVRQQENPKPKQKTGPKPKSETRSAKKKSKLSPIAEFNARARMLGMIYGHYQAYRRSHDG
jgi:ribosomal protein L37E